MHHDRTHRRGHRQPVEQVLGDPAGGVDDLHRTVGVPGDHLHQALRARGRLAHHRQPSVVGRLPQGGQHPAHHRGVARRAPLGLPRRPAAQAAEAGRVDQHGTGAVGEQPQRALRTRSRVAAVTGRPEHGPDAGGEVHRGRGGALRGPGVTPGVDLRTGPPGRPAAGQPPVVARHQLVRQHPAGHVGRRLGQPRHPLGHRHGGGRRQGAGTPYLRRSPPRDLPDGAGGLGPQPSGQVSGVDLHRADRQAHPVDGTGLRAVVVVLLRQLRRQRLVAPQLRRAHLAAHDDPLPRGRGQVPGGAHRLAEAALDAPVDLLLDLGGGLEVEQV